MYIEFRLELALPRAHGLGTAVAALVPELTVR